MSTLIEDRLAAALRARADQVQPEDLRPVDVPVVGLHERRPRRRTVVLAALAAAASAAAVAAPLALSGPDGVQGPPPTSPTETGGPTSSPERPLASVVQADVDGDGREDLVQLWRGPDGAARLLVEPTGAAEKVQAVTPLEGPVRGDLVIAADLGGLDGVEVLVPRSDDPADLPGVYTWDGGRLVATTYPDAPGNRWAILEDGTLRTWEVAAGSTDERVPYRDWYVDLRLRLRFPSTLQGCLTGAQEWPVFCGPDTSGKGPVDLGPRGGLPLLMPAVQERLSDERYVYGPDFFGPGSDDYAQLRGDFEPADGAEDGHVELVVTAEGVEHRAPVTAGGGPVLVPRYLAVHGDSPVLVVERPSGDTVFTSVYAFWDAELVELELEGDVFLGSGVVDYEGRLTEQRTWVTAEGQLFTAVLLDWESRRHRLWRWDVGRSVTPTDLGEACIDWEAGDYGRCP